MGRWPPYQVGRLPAALRSPRGREVEQLEPWCLTPIMFTWKALLRSVCRLGHEGERFVRRLPAQRTAEPLSKDTGTMHSAQSKLI